VRKQGDPPLFFLTRGSPLCLRGEGHLKLFSRRGVVGTLSSFFGRGGSPLIEMGNPPLSRGSTGRMLSVMTPREAVPPFMQKEGGRVPILIKSKGHLKIFWRRGVVGTLSSFFGGEGCLLC